MKKFITVLILAGSFASVRGYSQWLQAGQGFDTGNNPRISVADSNVAWISSGYDLVPKIYRTTNGGANWSPIPTAGLSNDYLISLAATSSATAFVGNGGGAGVGGNAKLFRTTNAGVNWTIMDSTGGTAGFYNDIIFSKTVTQFGIAMSDPPAGIGNPFHINLTTNGGMNWTVIHPPGVPDCYGVFYGVFNINPMIFGFVLVNTVSATMNSYISSNGGSNWFMGSDSSAIQLTSSADIVFADDGLTGIMISDSFLPNIKRTTNGGINWITVNTTTDITGISTASWVSGTNTVFICAHSSNSGNYIIRSDNAGLNWTGQTSANIGFVMEIDNIRFGDKVYAYAVTVEGKILKSAQTVNPIGINQIGNEVPSVCSLSQNYPNPFNPKTIINYSILSNVRGQTSNVKLVIYDVLGKEVATLVNAEQNAGHYTVEFDGNNYSSGIYFYKLISGEFSKTKKMFLTK